MLQTACLVVNPVTVDRYALLVNCTAVASDSRKASQKTLTSGLRLDAMTLTWSAVIQLIIVSSQCACDKSSLA